ncbi:PREDICTED: uncharacterized protein LOC105556398 isoform X2 [Vollenhovia emeryi]|uniref:uncharacterized protein LOC105556398 isoform X2 n=1 Tax=Vollenhovia emeryi TaxID=411798 RepID=UPI0005F47C1E|nr:PREDICTED: uncharacterized protein LOC105556398 isoform X2 [Vollenhovia emeryi]
MPKHKQYSHKYRRRISQHYIQEIENNLQAHKSDIYSAENCNNCLLEVNDNEIYSISEIASDEIIQEVQEEIVPEEVIVENNFTPLYEYHTDSSSESDCEHNGINIDRLQRNLVKWNHDNKICRSAMTSLLKVLKIEKAMQFFPSDARTFLKTPTKAESIPMEHGRYVHFGIAKGLHHIIEISSTITYLPEEIHLSINIDGLPLAKSSKSQLWPILGSFRNFQNKTPFLIGAFHGYQKPPDATVFLKYFIEEAMDLIQNGYTYNDINRKFIIDCFICDAPARAYICCIKNHGGYYACNKCETKGTYVNGKVVYPEMNAPLRTAESFAMQSDKQHHTGISPLLSLNIDMISQMPYDYMHLVILGQVKKMLKIITGKLNPMKLSAQQVLEISKRQLVLRKYVPNDFARKPRALDELDRMKATEFREFLLYTGPIVLRKIVRSDVYNHFIKLSMAIRLLATPNIDVEQNRYAKNLLEEYFAEFLQLYGVHNATYNTHGLLHLADDALQWGTLDEFSAFIFENHLQHIKKFIRGNNKPLEQLSNCIYEIRNSHCIEFVDHVFENYKLGKKYYNGRLINGCTSPMHKDIQFKNFKITIKRPNNYCIMTDESVVMIENICHRNNSVVVLGKKLKNGKQFFHSPAPSTCFGIIKLSNDYGILQAFPIENIKNKGVVLPIFDESNQSEDHHKNVVIFPLIHGQ